MKQGSSGFQHGVGCLELKKKSNAAKDVTAVSLKKHHAWRRYPAGSFGKVQIPFNKFTNCWDDGSGAAIVTCADDSSKCPTQSRLQNLQTLSVWAWGFEGSVKLDLKSVGTYGCGSLGDALPNIVELAQSVPDLSTLVVAVVAGDLVVTLTSASRLTSLPSSATAVASSLHFWLWTMLFSQLMGDRIAPKDTTG